MDSQELGGKYCYALMTKDRLNTFLELGRMEKRDHPGRPMLHLEGI